MESQMTQACQICGAPMYSNDYAQLQLYKREDWERSIETLKAAGVGIIGSGATLKRRGGEEEWKERLFFINIYGARSTRDIVLRTVRGNFSTKRICTVCILGETSENRQRTEHIFDGTI